MNDLDNVSLHKIGLADRKDELALHLIDKNNFGLGTFSTVEQYDLPLKEVCKASVEIGDNYLSSNEIGPIDAIKIDVQGFEQEVLQGLDHTLSKDRPVVWFEVGGETKDKLAVRKDICDLFPYRVNLFRFEQKSKFMLFFD